MKKYLKNLIFFLLLLLFLLVVSEVIIFVVDKPFKKEDYIGSLKVLTYDIKKESFDYRKTVGLEYKNRPIYLFSCSFPHGFGLGENQTFGYKLSKATKRPVYNFSTGGKGPQFIYYKMKREDHFNKKVMPEYIVYVYIQEHILFGLVKQLSGNKNAANLIYKKEKGVYKEEKPLFVNFWGLLTVKKIQEYFFSKISEQEKLKYFEDMLVESKKISDKRFPGSKFVILIYPKDNSFFKGVDKTFENLQKKGFIVIDLKKEMNKKLESDEYKIYDKFHPSEKAWDEITPYVAKKLNEL